MKHRHLNHQGYTLAAIDDIIARGKREDWADLADVAEADPEIARKIIRVCRAYVADPYKQRQRFWLRYTEEKLLPSGMRADKQKALMLAKRQLPELVCDAVNLEGISLTLPEIQVLLAGITVDGHALSDQEIALNQIEAWRLLFRWIENDLFTLSAEAACRLHAVAGKGEALESGIFRSGSVTIAGTDYMPPGADQLPGLFEQMVEASQAHKDIYDLAIHVFLTMARCQFFYDVNKRMGRFMMNGILLQAGFPVINVPARRQLEFNQLMLDFYPSGDQGPMNSFMLSCQDERVIRILKEVNGKAENRSSPED